MFINLLMSALLLGSIYGLIGLGYSLIYRASGIMNLAQGDLMCVGGFWDILSIQYIIADNPLYTFNYGIYLCNRMYIREICYQTYFPQKYYNLCYNSGNRCGIVHNTKSEIVIWGAAPLAVPSFLKTPTVKIFGVIYQTNNCLLLQ